MNIFFAGQYFSNIIKLGINLLLFIVHHFCQAKRNLFEENYEVEDTFIDEYATR
jgi:hypothetical protein